MIGKLLVFIIRVQTYRFRFEDFVITTGEKISPATG